MFSDIKDEDAVTEDNIFCKLPEAKLVGGTERALNHMTFYFDFANLLCRSVESSNIYLNSEDESCT